MVPLDPPPFAASTEEATRLDHLPTVEAGIRYWEAISERAPHDSPIGRTACTLVRVYRTARAELLGVGDGLQIEADAA